MGGMAASSLSSASLLAICAAILSLCLCLASFSSSKHCISHRRGQLLKNYGQCHHHSLVLKRPHPQAGLPEPPPGWLVHWASPLGGTGCCLRCWWLSVRCQCCLALLVEASIVDAFGPTFPSHVFSFTGLQTSKFFNRMNTTYSHHAYIYDGLTCSNYMGGTRKREIIWLAEK